MLTHCWLPLSELFRRRQLSHLRYAWRHELRKWLQAGILSLSQSEILKYFKRYKARGSGENKNRSGSPRKTDVHMIVRRVILNRRQTLSGITDWVTNSKLPISQNIHNREDLITRVKEIWRSVNQHTIQSLNVRFNYQPDSTSYSI